MSCLVALAQLARMSGKADSERADYLITTPKIHCICLALKALGLCSLYALVYTNLYETFLV